MSRMDENRVFIDIDLLNRLVCVMTTCSEHQSKTAENYKKAANVAWICMTIMVTVIVGAITYLLESGTL